MLALPELVGGAEQTALGVRRVGPRRTGAVLGCVAAIGLAGVLGCSDDVSDRGVTAGGAGAGSGGTAGGGAAGDGGAAGMTDVNRGGTGGNTCFQGTFAVGTRADGRDFDHPDGTTVTATFGRVTQQTATTSIQGGVFTIAFYEPNDSCNLGASFAVPAALYIDVNGDGACTLGADEVFVWHEYAGPGSGYSSNGVALPTEGRRLTPSSERCMPMRLQEGYLIDATLAAVRRLCPEVAGCLPFCSPPEPTEHASPQDFGGYCPAVVDAGVIDDAGSADGGVDAAHADAGTL